jgi:GNAT superfamily N-acetyltransferase
LVIALLPEAENKGVGRRLMKLAQEWLFSKGHQELWLMENPEPSIRAYHFYRKLGWIATGEFKHGEQVLKLQKGK